ncbi:MULTISPECIES: STAS-like domain-containing protein [unclassified Bradyrhizobium]|uniref:STAS-like domain-containing protein n=1 Tax=unclassified Bradyrhizobium TaxID=2631580 RepID=UPI002916EFA8|nr:MULTISPECIES: STAS-like domain-containing protein [unclassified Bradyrhizobium]
MASLRIADYAPSPGGRFIVDGEYSGEWFRDTVLAPALQSAVEASEALVVVLDGTSGYGSSFLEEAFGGLIRRRLFPPRTVREMLKITAETSLYKPYKALAEKYIQAAKPDTVAA